VAGGGGDGDRLAGDRAGELRCVATGAAVDGVEAAARDQGVGPRAADQLVFAFAADQFVVAALAEDLVRPAGAFQGVGFGRPLDRFPFAAFCGCGRRRDDEGESDRCGDCDETSDLLSLGESCAQIETLRSGIAGRGRVRVAPPGDRLWGR
jgi:hypothetical protein